MSDKELAVSADDLRAELSYDPETGALMWKEWKRGRKLSLVAGYIAPNGYGMLKFGPKYFSSHRVIWCMVHGKWPAALIDHKNGVKHDNRLSNLREATFAINSQNYQRASPRNKLGVMGVYKQGNRFRAQITVDNRTRRIGLFSTAEMAYQAYVQAKRKYHAGCTL